jgi:DNA polymerase III delta prime subunit
MYHKLFINKFQPRLFCDFQLENSFVEILNMLINTNTLNLLLIGDSGSGKTTLLDAIIREYYNGTEYDGYKENVLYINNLKEQGIHYYRTDVKTFCQTCSDVKGKKKIVVLDDIDFITEQSQQVFRNCIDKYSHNVHFISSCTNIQKVIESLQSRFICIKMKPLQRDELTRILNKIKQAENIRICPDAQEFVLDICNHSVKVLINYMEKFKLVNEEITLTLANQICTDISFITFEYYTELLKQNNLNGAINTLYALHDNGYSVIDILDSYFVFVKTTANLSEDDKYNIIPYICKYITIFHNIHEDEIELALFTNNIMQKILKK